MLIRSHALLAALSGAAQASAALSYWVLGPAVALVLSIGSSAGLGAPIGPEAAANAGARTTAHPVRHVFVVNIENKGFDKTWGSSSKAPYLARTLRGKGVLLSKYYGTAHNSQGNYIAQISGQGPNAEMQSDCQRFSNFVKTGTASPGQLRGTGCVFPPGTPTLVAQLHAAHRTWKAYLGDMGSSCRHPVVGTRDRTESAKVGDQYATKHNPFVYFHSIIDHPAYCKATVVPLTRLANDLKRVSSTPNLTYITPDLCDDGHDSPCVDGRPGGLVSVNTWMKRYVPKILASPAFRKDGLLVITADESDGAGSDSTACCGEGASTNSPTPGIQGPGGGRIGALVISPFTHAGTTSRTPYNHYSLLASIENSFGLGHIGYARTSGLKAFGADVYSK
ncbi:MAG: alkaline phosphatase family protein [Marmoricola sp.]